MDTGKEEHIISLDGLTIMHENALAATAIALSAGAQVKHITQGLRAFKDVPHRREHVASIGGVDYYNDSKATNPDAAIKAITSTAKPIVLIGGGYDKGADFDPWVKAFTGKVIRLILIGQATPQIIEACRKNGFTAYEQAGNLQEAVNRAAEIVLPGQAVLFSPACASFDMFKDYEERGDIFRQIVQSLT